MENNFSIDVFASTKEGYALVKEDALRIGGIEAGICYMDSDFNDIVNESEKNNLKRQKLTLGLGHQSVYGHPTYTMTLKNIPKILAMVLNNEPPYTTSEKSARYTIMENINPPEKELYFKWLPLFENRIKEEYPKIPDSNVKKLAQENARYMTSVFTPTTMGYSTDLRQLNYLMHWFNDFVEDTENNTEFNKLLKPIMAKFNNNLGEYYVEELTPKGKLRDLTLFAKDNYFDEFFNESYSTNYLGSFAQLAQAQRHRTLNYNMQPILETPNNFYIPLIINNHKLMEEWLNDLDSVAEFFPQATLVQINERGTYEDFMSKAVERLCSKAQLEIAKQTKETLRKFRTNTPNRKIVEKLIPYSKGPRCTFPDFICKESCNFGKKGLERLV